MNFTLWLNFTGRLYNSVVGHPPPKALKEMVYRCISPVAHCEKIYTI